ncbi:glycosyltransferase family 2 protein [Agromyces laixinhei]|uniref:glycosyltransferase family 2 protein n=1 Tax=Agromyces laixinhei TaxID=2585717 RepID=UPI00111732D4|nr:glycosyltransferase family A protein [Agromyces laixinhei]
MSAPAGEPEPDAAASVDVTVVIPTLNGERYLGEVLDAINAQEGAGLIETLVIDSGSTDATLDIVRSHPAARLHEIPNAEFGHGRTRNLGARLARGRVIAFLTQDATPAASDWLAELISPLAEPGVEAVFGRQIPRRHAFPLQKYDIEGVFAAQGPLDRPTLVAADGRSGDELDAVAFYSDVNSAARRSFLVDVIPLRDLPYSEDLAFARDVLEAGHRKAYSPRAAVLHSNDMGVQEYAARMFDETLGLRRVGHVPPTYSRTGATLRAIKGALVDSGRIVRDRDYRIGERVKWLAVNPAYQFARWNGLYHGARAGLDDDVVISRRSWERRQQRRA